MMYTTTRLFLIGAISTQVFSPNNELNQWTPLTTDTVIDCTGDFDLRWRLWEDLPPPQPPKLVRQYGIRKSILRHNMAKKIQRAVRRYLARKR